MKKLIEESTQQPTFAPPTSFFQLFVESFLPSKMSSSKPTLASIQTQVTELQTQFAALVARVDALSTAAPAADAAPAAKGKRVKKERDPDAPKRPLSSYLVFCAAERAKTPDVKIKVAELSERWNALSDTQKAAFKPAAASDAE